MVYIVIAYAVFFGWTLVELMTAPWGYEDEDGFHMVRKRKGL